MTSTAPAKATSNRCKLSLESLGIVQTVLGTRCANVRLLTYTPFSRVLKANSLCLRELHASPAVMDMQLVAFTSTFIRQAARVFGFVVPVPELKPRHGWLNDSLPGVILQTQRDCVVQSLPVDVARLWPR